MKSHLFKSPVDGGDPFTSAGSFSFWIEPANGEPPYLVDLAEFAGGGSSKNIASRARCLWVGDFTGRPAFARELAEMVRFTRPADQSLESTRWAMRHWFRFLDATPNGNSIRNVASITDTDGLLLRDWLGGTDDCYRLIKTALDKMRELQGLPRLLWPARARDSIPQTDQTDFRGLQALYRALKSEARAIKAMFAEGRRLANAGHDPRGKRFDQGFESAAWHRRENHAWLVRELTKDRLIDRQELAALSAYGLISSNDPETQKHDGPEYLSPGMSERGRAGMVGKLRWFHPSYHDTAVFLWLFLLGTGWNLSTALSLDITDDSHWFEPHPYSEGCVVIHAFKKRAERHQFTLSMQKPEWHPFNVAKFMIEATAALRETLRHRLREISAEYEKRPSRKLTRAIAELEGKIKSPWLYHVVNKTGEVNAFHHEDAARLNDIVRVVIAKHGLDVDHPSLRNMKTSDARDAWIGHAYIQSGYNLLLTRLASQHSNLRTLKHYLRSRRYRDHSEKQVRTFQNAVFGEIADGRAIDPTRIRLLVQNGSISDEQARRLADLRQRTRLGMGCLDPENPPAEIAPHHQAGKVCRVQRCTGCRHGVVFADSLRPLARALAELIFIKGQIPLAAWCGSSFEDEVASLEHTLAQFDRAAVDIEISTWLDRLKKGEVFPHDTYPSY
jgi:hypothetical protein